MKALKLLGQRAGNPSKITCESLRSDCASGLPRCRRGNEVKELKCRLSCPAQPRRSEEPRDCHHGSLTPRRGAEMEPYLPTSAVRQPPNEPPANGAASSSPSCVKRLTLELVESYLKTNPASKPIQTWRAAATTPRENGAKPKAPRRALTQPAEGVTNDGADNAEAELVTYAGDVLGPGGEGPAFEVLDKLGRGSFGQVFRCRSRKTGRLVAIKVVKNCRSYAAQAYVESQMARALHARDPHPNARRGVLVRIFPEPASPRHRAGVASMA